MTHWTSDDIPDLAGRRAVVTGANSGLGFHTALELARHGSDVTVAVRDVDRGEQAVTAMRAELRAAPSAGSLDVAALDLASMKSVLAFADLQAATDRGLDVLVNNAGVMAIPRRETADGFEMQLGTNHLGHAALTLRLLPVLVRAGSTGPTARVVTVSSNVHKRGRIDLDDLMGERGYKPWTAYGQSKLANLLFALELQRRLDRASLPVASFAAHPGYAATNLTAAGPTMRGSALQLRLVGVVDRVLGQPAAMGALPTLYAATEPGLAPGSYVGPDGFLEQRGYPVLAVASDAARDEAMAARLWERTEELVGLRFDEVVAAL
jgi:NAD(P)-dependent dehydrogenase (short-subunit alcohol dehydrogenase family)